MSAVQTAKTATRGAEPADAEGTSRSADHRRTRRSSAGIWVVGHTNLERMHGQGVRVHPVEMTVWAPIRSSQAEAGNGGEHNRNDRMEAWRARA